MTISFLHGDCRQLLGTLPERSAQTCITSPPYYGLRRYDVTGDQIGAEATPAAYVAALVAVFREVRRVLRDDGTAWVNLGDSFSDGKQLLGIPWRVALALQDDGWILRSDIIWSKPNPMPESVRDRPTRAHEYIFLLSKSARYYYDSDAISEPIAMSTQIDRAGRRADVRGNGHGGNGDRNDAGRACGESGNTRNRRSVWTIATQSYAGAHYAVFPEKLIEPCILAGSASRACEHCGAGWVRDVEREGECTPARKGGPKTTAGIYNDADRAGCFYPNPPRDRGFIPSCTCADNTGAGRSIVLDPFVGSGTTCRLAEALGRDSLGIDLGYADLQEERTNGIQHRMTVLHE